MYVMFKNICYFLFVGLNVEVFDNYLYVIFFLCKFCFIKNFVFLFNGYYGSNSSIYIF